jgi:hypothetical protein
MVVMLIQVLSQCLQKQDGVCVVLLCGGASIAYRKQRLAVALIFRVSSSSILQDTIVSFQHSLLFTTWLCSSCRVAVLACGVA